MGSGYRVFTAGEVLTASNVQDYLMDQSVMSFADSTARATSIGTANFEEGMVSYLQNTNQLEVYNGSAWASIAPTSTQGLTLINSQSFSAVSSQSLNNVFSSTYDNYKILLDFTDSSLDTEVTIRLRVSGVDASGANYFNRYLHGPTPVPVNNDNQTSFRFVMELDGATNAHVYSNIVEIKSPFKLETTVISLDGLLRGSAGSAYFAVGSAFHEQNISYDGFTLIASSGNITGTVSVYGYSK